MRDSASERLVRWCPLRCGSGPRSSRRSVHLLRSDWLRRRWRSTPSPRRRSRRSPSSSFGAQNSEMARLERSHLLRRSVSKTSPELSSRESCNLSTLRRSCRWCSALGCSCRQSTPRWWSTRWWTVHLPRIESHDDILGTFWKRLRGKWHSDHILVV